MSRRKQAKPKSTKRIDDEMEFGEEGGESDCDRDEIGEKSGMRMDVDGKETIARGLSAPDGAEDSQPAKKYTDGDDDDRESVFSEDSAADTPPNPNGGVARHECTYCDAAFGSFFLLKQHEQETHAHLMPFKCKFCAKGFKHKRSHDRHEKSHSGIRKHKCVYCGQAFFRSDHLKLHLKTHETSKYPFVCILCQRGFHSSAGLESHMQIHEKQKQSSCADHDQSQAGQDSKEGITMDLESKLSGHATGEKPTSKCPSSSDSATKFISNPPLGQSQCSVCSATFKTPDSLLRHMDNDHRILKCRMDTFSPMTRFCHKSTPSPLFGPTPQPASSSLVCPYCQVDDFFSEEALELHMRALHSVSPSAAGSNGAVGRKWSTPMVSYNCGMCGLVFSDIGLLQKHTLHNHSLKEFDSESGMAGRISMGKVSRADLSNSTDPTYQCQTCGRAFESILALHGHASSVHGSLPEHVATPASTNESRPSPATSVDYEMTNGTKMGKTPPIAHSQLYQCSQCENMSFEDLTAFSAHMSQHIRPTSLINSAHGHQQYPCDVCGVQLMSEAARDAHTVKHYLQKESQYSCKSCVKSFAVPDELQKHLLDMHAIHLYRCSLCKEIFESRVDIQVHFAVAHSDEVIRYRCRSCNAAFQSEDQFNVHVQAVHLNGPSGEKSEMGDVFQFPMTSGAGGQSAGASFCCPFCGDAFSVEYLYEKHLENVHRSQMEMFMLNEFIPKSSVSQLLAQATKFNNKSGHLFQNSEITNGDGRRSNEGNAGGSSATVLTLIKCNICDRRCQSMVELAEHKLQHCKVIRSTTCNFCHQPVNSMSEFHSHTRQHNSGNGIPMACIICKQSLVSAVDIQAHAKFHLSLSTSSNKTTAICIQCGKDTPNCNFESKSGICVNCEKNLDDGGTDAVKCRHCNLKFETVEERNEHEENAHGASISTTTAGASERSPKPYQCIKCQKCFATELEIQAHVTTHVLQDGIHHYCMLCKKVFDSPSKLQCHLIEHSFVGCSEMQCYLCNAIFALPQPLQQHMLTKHGVDDRPYECSFPQCEQKFFFRAELENHSLLHQAQQTTKPTVSDGSECENNTGSAALDISTTQTGIVCPICQATFTSASAFETHLTVCGPVEHERKQSRSSGRKEENSADDGLHYCPHCSKAFQSLSALQGHSHVHMVSKTHQCAKCRKIFPTAAKLRNHQRQHSGDKPFACTVCMRFFSRKDNLKVHMRIHYKQNGSPAESVSSPGVTASSSPNLSFPTMVPRSSTFLNSLTLGVSGNSLMSHHVGQHSPDHSMGAFPYNMTGTVDDDRTSAIDNDQTCHVNED